ncbi:hypothetical protein N234_16595 [Ralstonia pickettii DTP0602]|nr:hypothetical protein N234_16595 [Ralstonia pickettii DTP0602]
MVKMLGVTEVNSPNNPRAVPESWQQIDFPKKVKNQDILTNTRTLSRDQIAFCGALLGLLLSKGLALFPAYGLDDYVAVHQDRHPLFYVSQGRFTQAAIQVALSTLGVTPTSIAWTSTLLFFIFAALAISSSLLYIARTRGNGFTFAAAGALIGAHPYLTEYFTFRESLITQGTAFGLLALVFVFARYHENTNEKLPRLHSLGWLAIPLVLLAGAQQTTFIVAFFVVLARITVDSLWSSQQRGFAAALRANAPVIFAFAAAIVIYVLAYKICRNALSAALDTRGSIVALTEIIPRIAKVGDLTWKILIQSEPVLSAVPKILLALIILFFLGKVGLKSPKIAAMIVCMTAAMYLGSVFLITISAVWWPVPRAVYGVGFVYGVVLSVISLWLSHTEARQLSIGALIVAIIFSFHSNAMLHDQARLNRWDSWVAGGIAKDLLKKGISADQKVTLVGAKWRHPIGMRTLEGDLNASALPVAWAAQYLMMEVTGRSWNVDSVAQAEQCRNSPPWPADESIKIISGSVFVCMGER